MGRETNSGRVYQSVKDKEKNRFEKERKRQEEINLALETSNGNLFEAIRNLVESRRQKEDEVVGENEKNFSNRPKTIVLNGKEIPYIKR